MRFEWSIATLTKVRSDAGFVAACLWHLIRNQSVQINAQSLHQIYTWYSINNIHPCTQILLSMQTSYEVILIAEMRVQVAEMRLVLVAEMRLVLLAEMRLVLVAEMRLVPWAPLAFLEGGGQDRARGCHLTAANMLSAFGGFNQWGRGGGGVAVRFRLIQPARRGGAMGTGCLR